MTLALSPRGGGTVIPLHVRPGAARITVGGEHNSALKVSVTASPEKGKATGAVLDAVAEALGIRSGLVRLVKGEASREKAVWVPLDVVTVLKRLGSV